MPNTREKLIEVLKQAPFEGKVLDEWWWEEKIARIADHLIANGVTVQKWIPVTERLPEEDGEYITMTNASGKGKGVMSLRYRTDLIRGQQVRRWHWLGRVSPWDVTHWMPLPEPPKGE